MSNAEDEIKSVINPVYTFTKEGVKKGRDVLIGEMPEMPTLPEPTIMPTVDDARTDEVRRRALLEQRARGGRQSTILSTTDQLG